MTFEIERHEFAVQHSADSKKVQIGLDMNHITVISETFLTRLYFILVDNINRFIVDEEEFSIKKSCF